MINKQIVKKEDNMAKVIERELEIYSYLDELRESGKVNMMGATPYLVQEFSLSEKEAKDALFSWMSHA
jgi:hypothetical protein